MPRGNCNFNDFPVKNVIFLSPNFPPHYWKFLKELKLQNVNVLAIGDTPYHELPWEVKQNITEYRGVDSLYDYDGVYRHVAFWASVYGRPNRIESLNETWLEIEAKLRLDYNVPGLLPQDLQILRTKMGMHDLFVKAGIPHPPATMCKSPQHVKDFAKIHGYPLVLKPDVGVGAAGQFKATNDLDVDEAFKTAESMNPQGLSEYVAQKWCFGKVVTYDGMVDRNGKILFRLTQQYAAGVMEAVVDRFDMYFYNWKQPDEELEKLGKRVVETLGLRERWFHNEFFLLEDGSYVVLEANLRPPGCWIVDAMNYACETNVYKLWTDMILDKVDPSIDYMTFTPAKWYIAHIALRRHGEVEPRNYTHSHDDCVEYLNKKDGKFVMSLDLPVIYYDALGTNLFLTKHETLQDLIATQEYIQETEEIKREKELEKMGNLKLDTKTRSRSGSVGNYDSKSPQTPMRIPARKNSRGYIS